MFITFTHHVSNTYFPVIVTFAICHQKWQHMLDCFCIFDQHLFVCQLIIAKSINNWVLIKNFFVLKSLCVCFLFVYLACVGTYCPNIYEIWVQWGTFITQGYCFFLYQIYCCKWEIKDIVKDQFYNILDKNYWLFWPIVLLTVYNWSNIYPLYYSSSAMIVRVGFNSLDFPCTCMKLVAFKTKTKYMTFKTFTKYIFYLSWQKNV